MDEIQYKCQDCGKWLEGKENIKLVCVDCELKEFAGGQDEIDI